jgi:tRNA pseudouridine(38-40) synthase
VHKDSQFINGSTWSTESYLDQRLREFFANRKHFRAAQFVVESVLSQKLVDIDSPCQPLLLKIDNLSSEYHHHHHHPQTDDNNLKQIHGGDETLFDILYHTTRKQDEVASDDIENDNKQSRKKGQSFKLKIAYRGRDFCGWQIQSDCELPSVQQTIINQLDHLLNANSNKPLDVRVCGRTDSGVSAIGQYCRVRTVRCDVGVHDIQKAINHGMGQHEDHEGPVSLLCTHVQQVSDKFHPTFDASCRAYIYLIDAPPLLALCQELTRCNVTLEDIVSIMNSMFGMIQGETLDYIAFSFGKVKTENTLCQLSHVRARAVETNDGDKTLAVAIELVGDRFLRRMVRILVATAVREVLLLLQDTSGQSFEAKDAIKTRLLCIVEERDRSQTAKAAASDGLLFVGARFRDKK